MLYDSLFVPLLFSTISCVVVVFSILRKPLLGSKRQATNYLDFVQNCIYCDFLSKCLAVGLILITFYHYCYTHCQNNKYLVNLFYFKVFSIFCDGRLVGCIISRILL